MAVKKRSEVIEDFEDHINANGGHYEEWFVGHTQSPKTRLFQYHKLRERGDAWICRRTLDEEHALEVEEYFRSVRGLKTLKVPANEDAVYVYAYHMKSHTSP